MVTLRKIFLLVIISLNVALYSSAQEIKIVSTGQGTTEDEATKTALRSALEDAYGTFISSSTKIENDVLVSDEIVSLTQGNIKEYDVVNSSLLANGLYSVTVESVVSLNKFATYCQSKGMSISFNGKAFVMELKMKEFNRQNEIKILKNLAQQIILMPSNLYDFELQTTEPQLKRKKKEIDFSDELLQSLLASEIELDEIENEIENVVSIFVLITPHSTPNMSSVSKLYESTVKSISLTKDERKLYDKLGLPYYEEKLYSNSNGTLYFRDKNAVKLLKKIFFTFRNASHYYWVLVDDIKGVFPGIYCSDYLANATFLKNNPRPEGIKEIINTDWKTKLEYIYTLNEMSDFESIYIKPNEEAYETIIKPKLLNIIAEFDSIK